MSNMKDLAKGLAKNTKALGYVNSAGLDEVRQALNAALEYACAFNENQELIDELDEALQTIDKVMANTLSHGHALDILSRMGGQKDWNSVAVLKDKKPEQPEQPVILDGSIDYLMSPTAEGDRIWVEAGAYSLQIKRESEGIIVDLFATGCEDCGSVGSAALEWGDAEALMRETRRGWVIYSPSEAMAGDGAGYWSNQDGWVSQDECTIFTATEKESARLPLASNADAHWVSLDTLDPETSAPSPKKQECARCGLPTSVDDEGLCNECHRISELPIFILGEEITHCPHCSSRTQFDELPGGRQHHTCLNDKCRFEFLGDPPEDDDEDDDEES